MTICNKTAKGNHLTAETYQVENHKVLPRVLLLLRTSVLYSESIIQFYVVTHHSALYAKVEVTTPPSSLRYPQPHWDTQHGLGDKKNTENGSRENIARRYPQFKPKRGPPPSFVVGIVWNITTVLAAALSRGNETYNTRVALRW